MCGSMRVTGSYRKIPEQNRILGFNRPKKTHRVKVSC